MTGGSRASSGGRAFRAALRGIPAWTPAGGSVPEVRFAG